MGARIKWRRAGPFHICEQLHQLPRWCDGERQERESLADLKCLRRMSRGISSNLDTSGLDSSGSFASSGYLLQLP